MAATKKRPATAKPKAKAKKRPPAKKRPAAPPAAPAEPATLDADVTAAELGRALDLTARRIQQLAKDGVIPRSSRGKYPLLRAVRAYVRHIRETGEHDGPVDPSKLKPFERRAHFDAENARIAFEQRVGDLVPRADFEESIARIVGAFVSFLEILGDRAEREGFADRLLAARLGTWADELREEIYRMLRSEIEARAAGTGKANHG